MITVKRSEERRVATFGWLETRLAFSPEALEPLGFGPMCVMNEHWISPGQGFKSHRHRDLEIVSYVIDGQLEHKDSIGSESVLRAGDFQALSCGTGMRHSEFNASNIDPLHFLQFWVVPHHKNAEPRYHQTRSARGNNWDSVQLVASLDGRNGSVPIQQDVDVLIALLHGEDLMFHNVASNRRAWLQVARGSVAVNGEALGAGDAAAIEGTTTLTLSGRADFSEVLLIDMA